MEVLECKNKKKIGNYRRFAECQASLPSAMATALGKAGKNWRKTPDFPALPSVIARTLGKAGLFAECQATALGKGEGFAECHRRHSAKRLFFKK